jgi:hypothetical protein
MHSADESRPASQVERSNIPSKVEPMDPPKAYILNIIFHGPFCFIRYDDHIEALTPAAMGHVYGVGTFRKEYSMSNGAYYLIGVDNQTLTQDVNNKTALIFPKGIIKDIDPQNVAYCKVVIPTSAKIAPLGLFKPPQQPPMFVGTNAVYGNGVEKFGSCHVFTYYNVYKDKVSLSETLWYPEPIGDYINLHIFATSVFQLEMNHSVQTFHDAMGMLSNSYIEINPGVIPQEFKYINPDDTPWPGVDKNEQLPLHLIILPGTPLIPPRICDAASAFVTV